jgi:CcmD family protein
VAAPAMAQGQPPEPQDEFRPVGNNPAPEQIPAAPLLIGAYVVVLAGLFAYVVSLSRRLSAVQQDVARLEGDVKRKGR